MSAASPPPGPRAVCGACRSRSTPHRPRWGRRARAWAPAPSRCALLCAGPLRTITPFYCRLVGASEPSQEPRMQFLDRLGQGLASWRQVEEATANSESPAPGVLGGLRALAARLLLARERSGVHASLAHLPTEAAVGHPPSLQPRTHARTHALTHTRMHAHTHTHARAPRSRSVPAEPYSPAVPLGRGQGLRHRRARAPHAAPLQPAGEAEGGGTTHPCVVEGLEVEDTNLA